MQAACNWLDAQPDRARSFCIISPGNQASVNVAQKLGYGFVLDTTFGTEKTGVYFRDSGSLS
jgi:RimJ/RimL family protein N-acetyltransferase